MVNYSIFYYCGHTVVFCNDNMRIFNTEHHIQEFCNKNEGFLFKIRFK